MRIIQNSHIFLGHFVAIFRHFVVGLLCLTFNQVSLGKSDTVNVLAFGDSGTGSAAQRDVADGMRRACQRDGCDFGIMLGDNFYDDGVGNVDDKQFIEKFEKPYSPLKIPFYVALGNHDDRGDTQAQVDYSARSSWWKMPAHYYSKVIGDVHLIAIDSNDFDSDQRDFVAKTLRASKSKWKVVFGHHPIHSYGSHGDTYRLTKDLLPLLCEYGSIYVAGHDHDLQILRSDCGLPLVISGAAAKLRSTHKGKRTVWSSSQLGFARIEFRDKGLAVIMYDDLGLVITESTFPSEWGRQDYREIDNRSEVNCRGSRLVSGFSYSYGWDQHIDGVYCSESQREILAPPIVVDVNDQPGAEYDVFCPEADQAVGAILYKPSGDDHLDGLICQKVRSLSDDSSSKRYFVAVVKKLVGMKAPHCRNNDVVVGVRYDDKGDDHITGIYCH